MKTCSVYIDSRTGHILDILSKHSRAFLLPTKGWHNAKQCKLLVSLTLILLHSYAKNLYKYIKKGNKIKDYSYSMFSKRMKFCCCTKEQTTYFEKDNTKLETKAE